MNRRILVISDTHAPFQHPDTIKFLKAIKTKYKPDRVIHIGDEIDSHAMSYHDTDPDSFSAGDELVKAREVVWQMEELFPKVDVIESNHGSLWYRKAKTHGIPREAIKTYEEILFPRRNTKWKWHYDLEIKLPNGQPVYFHHGKSANYLLASNKFGMSFVQGHYHGRFGIQYWGTKERLNFAMQVGCLIDDDALAFEYNKTTMDRPIIGCGMIIDSQPKLIPLVKKRDGRWSGRLT
jgi:hypothetical protein